MKKVKINFYWDWDWLTNEYYRYGVVVCPYCGYECDGILHDGRYPSLFDDVCEHFDHITEDEEYVIFKEEDAAASRLIDPFERY